MKCLLLNFFISLILLNLEIVFADCLACYELKGVKIVMKNGKTILGYVQWNDRWSKSTYKFPKSLIFYLLNERKINTIKLYTNIHVFNYPFPNAHMVTPSEISIIKISDIKRISSKKGKYNNIEGAGEIPIVSTSSLNLLKNKPYAQIMVEEPLSDVYFLSYDKNVDESKLREISTTDFWGKRLELEKKKIIILEYPWD